jgi:hypothetical protein
MTSWNPFAHDTISNPWNKAKDTVNILSRAGFFHAFPKNMKKGNMINRWRGMLKTLEQSGINKE